jgi:hypothetical protein
MNWRCRLLQAAFPGLTNACFFDRDLPLMFARVVCISRTIPRQTAQQPQLLEVR